MNARADIAQRSLPIADMLSLAKPRIVMMVLITALGGLVLAPGTPTLFTTVALLVGTALMVGSANTFNMYHH